MPRWIGYLIRGKNFLSSVCNKGKAKKYTKLVQAMKMGNSMDSSDTPKTAKLIPVAKPNGFATRFK